MSEEYDNTPSMVCVLKEQTEIPEDFPIKLCKPSRRGLQSLTNTVNLRKKGRPLSWDVAEGLLKNTKDSDNKDEKEVEHLPNPIFA